MEPKKNQNLELKRNSTVYFFMGMVLVLLMAYVALEWKTYLKTPEWSEHYEKPDVLPDEIVPITKIELPKPKIVHAPPIIEIIDDDSEKPDDIIEIPESGPDTEIIPIDNVEVADEDEPEIIPWVLIEDAPVFPGCENIANEKDKRACFQEMMQQHIRKNFRYPEPAKDMGLQGRVHVIFTIQKDGSIGDVRMRGPHKILEEEASRIISKLPKMTPGKQRGNPVKVPFSIPITFQLQ